MSLVELTPYGCYVLPRLADPCSGGAEEPRDEGEEGDEEEPGAENPVKRKVLPVLVSF